MFHKYNASRMLKRYAGWVEHILLYTLFRNNPSTVVFSLFLFVSKANICIFAKGNENYSNNEYYFIVYEIL